MLTFGSLFAGIGGFDLGFHQVGMRCAWQVEKDASCCSVLARHWPDVPRFGDVRRCGADTFACVDILCGGFPCQDLSVAGSRAGLSGERSGLFYEMTRITDELRPAFLIWENVPGLLSSDSGRDFARVLVELERIGYSGCWSTLDAQFFGLAQRRQRVFGVFARADIGAARCVEILSLTSRLPWNTEKGRAARTGVASAITRSAGHHGRSSPRGDGSDNLIAHTLTANYGKQVDSSDTNQGPDDNSGQAGHLVVGTLQAHSKEHGHAMTTQQAAESGHIIIQPLLRQPFDAIIGGIEAKNSSYEGGQNANATQGRPDQELPLLRAIDDAQTAQERRPGEHVAFQAPEVLRQGVYGSGVRREACDEHADMGDSSLPRTEGDSQREVRDMREAGTSGRTPQERRLAKQRAEQLASSVQGVSHACTPRNEGMQDLRPKTQGPRILREASSDVARGATTFGVRRLTPLEAERLQGFPDNWTAGQSDSTRYRQLGNAVAVPVVAWIGQRIMESLH